MTSHPFASASAVVSQQYYITSSLIATPVVIKKKEKSQNRPLPEVPVDTTSGPSSSNEHTHTKRSRPTGSFVRSDGRFKIMLYGQQEDCSVPTYDRGSIFDGAIAVLQPENILKIEANVSPHIGSNQIAKDMPSFKVL